MPTSASSNAQINLSSYISTSSRIVSVQIFVSTSSRVVPPNFNLSMFAGLEYQYEIGPSIPIIFIWTTPANSYNLYGQPVRVLVTIKK
jgi:hypothetical protein